MNSHQRKSFSIFVIFLMINSVWAEPLSNELMTGLVQVATKEMVRNWVQSRAKRGLVEEFSISARSVGKQLASRSFGILTALSLSPLFLPIWLPLLIFGTAFFVTTVAPQAIPAFVRLITPTLRQFTPMFQMIGLSDVTRSFEPEFLARALQPGELLERGLDVLEIPEHECRRKMFCEAGSFTLDKQPGLARFLDLFSDTVSRAFPTYAEPLVRGIRGNDCSKLYDKCEMSPFAKVINFYFV